MSFFFYTASFLRIHSFDRPWEGDRFANVLNAAQPGSDAFHPHAESRMWDRPELTEFEIPFEGVFGQLIPADACQ